MLPKAEAEQEGEQIPPELKTELEDIDEDVRAETVFGITDLDAVRRAREMKRRWDAAGYAPGALSPPWWPEAENKWVHAKGAEYIEAPQLFTTAAAAEEECRVLERSMPEAYLQLVDRYGEADASKAFDNTVPLRAVWTDRDSLLDSLEDSDFLCLMVDGVLKLRRMFIEELREQVKREQ
ncbi:MAG: hypothetical protein JOZ19_08295 [Rubrobacter sp.]|nr:hypothetical protein [Rubrobacter sp.]